MTSVIVSTFWSRSRLMRRGSIFTPPNSHIHGSGERSTTRRMNSSVKPTETLKFFTSPSRSFTCTNSSTSGWSTRMTAMFAPCLPCCLITEKASL